MPMPMPTAVMLPPTGDHIDAFSDISTGSKKEFLRRYKRQILNEGGSTSDASSSCTSSSGTRYPDGTFRLASATNWREKM